LNKIENKILYFRLWVGGLQKIYRRIVEDLRFNK